MSRETGPFRDEDFATTGDDDREAAGGEPAISGPGSEPADSTNPFGPEEDGGSDDGPGGWSETLRRPWVIGLALVLVAGIAGLWLGTAQKRTDDDPEDLDDDVIEAPDAETPDEVETLPGDLYFPGSGGRLYGEQRDLPAGTPAARARYLVDALLAGPAASDSGLRSPLPPGTRLETVYLMGTTAVLDLRPAEPEGESGEGPPTAAQARRRQLSFGSKQELLALYSLVNTVALGVEGVSSVQILWDGRQPETFAGHVDTTRPLPAAPGYIAGR